jgi:MFS transporter, putative metabolite:H+ symporter
VTRDSDAFAVATIAERLEQLPAGRGLRRLVLRISAGGWFEFYDLFMTAYIALGLIRHGLFSATGSDLASVAGFTAAGFAGMFAGTLLFGSLSDRFGRTTTFRWSLLFYSVMTAAMALAPGALAIDFFRLLAGLGIGVQIITIDAYLTEIAPKDVRGQLIAFSQAITYTAVPAVALLSYLLVPRTIAGLDGWRVVALIGAIGAVTVWPIARRLIESPRWLAGKGRFDEAQAALAAIEASIGVQGARGDWRQPPPPAPAENTSIWSSRYRKRTLMLVAFNIVQTIGYYGFAAFIPLLLFQGGIAFVKSLEYTSIIALCTPIGPLFAQRFADRFERKWQIVVLALVSGVAGLLLGIAGAPWAILVLGMVITLANTWFTCAFHAYQSELYPTRMRGSAVGFVYSWSRLSSIFVGFIYAAILRHAGSGAAFFTIGLAMVTSATIVALAGPLTSRRRVEVLAP